MSEFEQKRDEILTGLIEDVNLNKRTAIETIDPNSGNLGQKVDDNRLLINLFLEKIEKGDYEDYECSPETLRKIALKYFLKVRLALYDVGNDTELAKSGKILGKQKIIDLIIENMDKDSIIDLDDQKIAEIIEWVKKLKGIKAEAELNRDSVFNENSIDKLKFVKQKINVLLIKITQLNNELKSKRKLLKGLTSNAEDKFRQDKDTTTTRLKEELEEKEKAFLEFLQSQ